MGGDFSQFAFSSAGHLNSPKAKISTAQAEYIDFAKIVKKCQVLIPIHLNQITP